MVVALTGCLNTNAVYQITPGMSRIQVYKALGNPARIESCGDFETWYYQPWRIGSYYQYLEVTFDNGRVASFIYPGEDDLRRRDLVGLPDYGSLPESVISVDKPYVRDFW